MKNKKNLFKQNFLLGLILFSLLFTLLPYVSDNVRAVGNTYYVSTTGSDSTGTGTIGKPFKTIQKGINMTVAGDTLYIRGGTYNKNVLCKNNGTAGNWIHIRGYPGETAIIDGTGIVTGGYGLLVVGWKTGASAACSYIRISNLTIQNSDGRGIMAQGNNAGHIIIENCNIHAIAGQAILFWAYNSASKMNNITVRNNTVYWSNTTINEHITFKYVERINITGNYMYGCKNIYICVSTNCSYINITRNRINATFITGATLAPSIYIGINVANRGTLRFCRIENNTIWGRDGRGIGISNEYPSANTNITDVIVANNIINFTASTKNVIGIWCDERFTTNYNISIIYNTVYINSNYNFAYAGSCFYNNWNKENTHGLKVANNIFFKSGEARFNMFFQTLNRTQTCMNISYNLCNHTGGGTKNYPYFGYFGTESALYPVHTILTNPFIKSNTSWKSDFHLNYTSPCIDSSNQSILLSKDHDGNSRPQGKGYDIGAYEWSPDISFSGVSPANTSTVTTRTPVCSVTITSPHGYQFNYTLQTNSTGGTWTTRASGNNQGNGSYSFVNINSTKGNTKYYWRVTTVNHSVWNNATYYFISPLTITPGFLWNSTNSRYGVKNSITFNNWTLGSTWLNLNGVGLNFSSSRATWINFSSFNSTPKHTTSGQTVLNFTTNATDRLSTFNISGLKTSYSYMVLNGSTLLSLTSSAAGQLQWMHNLTTAHTFVLYDWPYTSPILTEQPTNGSTGLNIKPTINITAIDPGFNIKIRILENTSGTWRYVHNETIASGGFVSYTYINASSYNHEYWWKVISNNSATPNGWSNQTHHFITREAQAPILSSPLPSDGATGVSIFIDHINITIYSPDGVPFRWNITTTPDIGTDQATGETNGTKTINITGLQYSTTYTWTSSSKTNDSTTWTNQSYQFTTTSAPSTMPDYGNTQTNLVTYIIPTVIALTLIVILLAMLYAGGLTVESFVTWLIMFFIAMIAIFTIFGISI